MAIHIHELPYDLRYSLYADDFYNADVNVESLHYETSIRLRLYPEGGFWEYITHCCGGYAAQIKGVQHCLSCGESVGGFMEDSLRHLSTNTDANLNVLASSFETLGLDALEATLAASELSIALKTFILTVQEVQDDYEDLQDAVGAVLSRLGYED